MRRTIMDDYTPTTFHSYRTPPVSAPTAIDALLAASLPPGTTDPSTAAARLAYNLPSTPLEVLDRTIKSLFDYGPEDASLKYSALEDSVLRGATVVDRGYVRSSLARYIIEQFPWYDSKLATRLVLLFACMPDLHRMLEAMRFQNEKIAGITTMQEVNSTPSADLPSRFALAKREALSEAAQVTVLGVSLVDVESLERMEAHKGLGTGFSSYAHNFALAIGREGWRMYQACEKNEYRLDEWLMRINGGSRLRNWEAAEGWMGWFRRICGGGETWTARLNDAYTACFDVDLDFFCGEGRPYPPLIPVYRPWVKIQQINDVKVEDICKFEWKVGRSWD
ncbi:hypothetical protein BJX68DRAFT_213340 [Aspergillus pseudodeflectus]|uniref:Uncharacterized protein n=1 Tax=Aspergillus pseudodeflectus TaxID=176178 RepID=A0ABR4JEF2_9EURO